MRQYIYYLVVLVEIHGSPGWRLGSLWRVTYSLFSHQIVASIIHGKNHVALHVEGE